MLTLPSSVRVYLAAEPVDLRRGHDGLVALVRSEWRLNPFDGHLFVFLGRRLDRVKILVWDRNGFVLYYKRLSQGRFRMPKIPSDVTRVERRDDARDVARWHRREVRAQAHAVVAAGIAAAAALTLAKSHAG